MKKVEKVEKSWKSDIVNECKIEVMRMMEIYKLNIDNVITHEIVIINNIFDWIRNVIELIMRKWKNEKSWKNEEKVIW